MNEVVDSIIYTAASGATEASARADLAAADPAPELALATLGAKPDETILDQGVRGETGPRAGD